MKKYLIAAAIVAGGSFLAVQERSQAEDRGGDMKCLQISFTTSCGPAGGSAYSCANPATYTHKKTGQLRTNRLTRNEECVATTDLALSVNHSSQPNQNDPACKEKFPQFSNHASSIKLSYKLLRMEKQSATNTSCFYRVTAVYPAVKASLSK